ncbi:MAG: glycine cleavage system protein GcvH [Chthoniobacterales bacterium]
MSIPADLKYAESHEWIRVQDNIGTVGITDHAQAELSDIVFVEAPAIGKKVSAKGNVAVVESVKAASDIYSPVSGEVIEANPLLESNSALLNTDPYGDGWIYKIKIENADELQQLKDAAGYKAQIGE